MGQLKKNKRYLKGVPLSMSELLSSFEKKNTFLVLFVCLFVYAQHAPLKKLVRKSVLSIRNATLVRPRLLPQFKSLGLPKLLMEKIFFLENL